MKCPHLAACSVWILLGKNDLDDGEAFSISICSSPDLCQSRMQCGKFQLQYEDAERFLERFPFQKVILPIAFFQCEGVKRFLKIFNSGSNFFNFLFENFHFNICSSVCFVFPYNLFVCRTQVGVWDRVDPRQKLLIVALVVLNCLQPLQNLVR